MIGFESLDVLANAWAALMWRRAFDFSLAFILVGAIWYLMRKRVAPQFGYWLFILILIKLIITTNCKP